MYSGRLIIITMILLISSCTPSEKSIQTAIAQTQAAQPIALPTLNPCSDKGWEDIAFFLSQFDQKANNLTETYSVQLYDQPGLLKNPTIQRRDVQELAIIKERIMSVSIAPCTESARRLIVGGLEYQMLGLRPIYSGDPDYEKSFQEIADGINMVFDGRTELEKLGINLIYP